MGYMPIFWFLNKRLYGFIKVMSKEGLTKLLEPVVEQLGFELADIEVRLGGQDGLLRLYIDKDGGIDVEDCQSVSRQVSAILDVEDPLPGNYTLEVSSPGLDRTLTKPAHFQRFMGEDIRVKLRFPLEGRRNFRGALKSANEENIEVEVDGESHSLSLATIESARLVPSL
jgi:ribosome maturation factor RimP